MIRTLASKLSKGGAGLLHKSNVDLIERPDLNISSHVINGSNIVIEDLWYETNNTDRDNCIIGVIYKHPGGSI